MDSQAGIAPPESILEEAYRLIQAELKAPGLSRIPKDIYKRSALHVKQIRSLAENNERSVISLLAAKERGLLSELISRLLEIRVKKMFELGEDDDSVSNATAEEKHVLEALTLLERRLSKIESSVRNGRVAALEGMWELSAARRIVVRFKQQSSAFIGSDLKQYGPFEPEDVAVLPWENARHLVKRGVAVEVWDLS